MRSSKIMKSLLILGLTCGAMAVSSQVRAQAIDPAIYIDFDTSGSMLQAPDNAVCYGDGSVEHPHNGACVSRMYTAKNALTTAIYGYPEVRWGLARFRQQEGDQIVCICDNSPGGQSDVHASEEPGSCETWTTALNYDLPGTVDRICINYSGGFGGPGFCGGGVDCCDAETQSIDLTGADILVALANDTESLILSWLDHQETDFQSGIDPSSGNHCWDGSAYGDCELRALGGTPIAGSLRDLYTQLSTVDLGNDPQRGCRPYSVVLLTDGDESCESQNDAEAEAAALLSTPDLTQNCGAGCPPNSVCQGGRCQYEVKTYVIAFALSSTTNADGIAAAGGTGAAVPAVDEDDIIAAMAQIVSEAVAFERCNSIDDNCNGQIDEGFPVGQACNNGLLGVCFAQGNYICDVGDDTAVVCDIPGGYPNPGDNAEVCDGLDNDCDGDVDEDGVCICNGPELCNAFDDYCDGYATLPDGAEDPRVGQPCGTDVGACVSGTTQCAGGTVSCSAVGPVAEVCDANITANDQNCNGVNNDGIAPTPCNVTNASGTCTGMQTCDVDGGWICWARTPAPEDCNGIDDDCNGSVDDGLSATCQVSNGWGTCNGTRTCNAGVWGACNAQTPLPETCDNTDQNCNGQVDENLTQSCQITVAGVGTCNGSQVCSTGSWSSCSAQTPVNEICNNLDDNCDGQIDESLAQSCYSGPAGTAGTGLCVAGTQSCITGAWTGCVGEVIPQAEVCDGQDNDCDGQTDENMGQTTCGLGICQHAVNNCVGGSQQLCDPLLGAQAEICNSIDDDCDGVVDGLTEACYSYVNGCNETAPGVWSCDGVCSTGTRTCPVGGGGWGACQFDAGPGTEICDGLDNDCDGQIDEDAGGNPLIEVCYSPGSGTNTGCTYDGPSDTWSCMGACGTGVRTCTLGVLGPCVGEVTPAVEQCNTIDDDCDGLVDEPQDIPGLNQPCGTALGLCTPGLLVCQNGVPDCQGGTGPFAGLCNGEDDDCDGQIDEADEVAQDPDIGLDCGDATGLCEPGTTQCFGGQLACVGGVLPAEEVCDGTDNDCDELIDEGDLCDAGFFCVQADCRLECDATAEFPCPGNLVCETVTVNGQTTSVCLPPAPDCGGETCPDGWSCVGNQCVDLCDPNPCRGWEECHQGTCVDVSCSGLGQACPDGEFCLNHGCEPDPCLGVNCEAMGGYCERRCTDGDCAATCQPLCYCAPDEVCDSQGGCAPDPCADVTCGLGERCDPATASCEPDPCAGSNCDFGQACFEGDCIDNPCALLQCPRFFNCEIATTTDASGDPAPDAQCIPNGAFWVDGADIIPIAITASGRGGCNTGDSANGAWLVGLLLLGLMWRRRRRKILRATQAVAVAALVLPLILLVGCKINTFTGNPSDGGIYVFPDGDVPLDDAAADGGDSATCEPGPEVCDGVDNDCDGLVDNVDASRLADDIHNCGDCGTACNLAGAFPSCVGGQCAVDYCFPGHHDLNGDPTDGCEYDCAVTNAGIEVCDGVDNDCNGQVDETFDLQNDPNNCGACFNGCAFFQGVGGCVAGQCTLSACNGGFVDLDNNALTGCECQMGVTEGTTVCDPTNPTACGAGEVCTDVSADGVSHCAPVPVDGCDAVDNDCDGQVDEDAPALLGTTDCYTHPVGCTETSPGVFTCQGACQAGAPTCVAGNVVCASQTGPSAEICDGVDNDCDGVADDGFDLTTDVTNCGGCNVSCPQLAGANSFATGCVAGACVFACHTSQGFHDLNGDVAQGSAGDGCEYNCLLSNGGVEACGDGLDNNCDGQIDEGFDMNTDPQNCGTCGVSCAANTPFQATSNGCAGGSCVFVCQAGQHDADGDLALGVAGTGCEYACATSNGGVEACDDLDNDCDGQVDEDFAKQTNPANCGSCGYQCAAHVGNNSVVAGCSGGVCQFACVAGWVDTNGDVTLGDGGDGCDYACTVTGGGVETCDTLDNDCNGQVDDDGAGGILTLSCYAGPGGTEGVGTCRAGTRTCSAGAYGACLGEVQPQVELCDNLDNDCDGVIDNGIDTSTDVNNCGACGSSCWSNVGANAFPSACVAGACQYSCLSDHSDLNGDLGLGASGDGCEYACPQSPPGLEFCDGIDNDCNGITDDGLIPPAGFCYGGVDGPGPELPGSPQNNPCSGALATCMDPDGGGGVPHDWYCLYGSSVETEPTNPNQLLGYETRCDGFDGDCDGIPDDSFNVDQACDDGGIGACRGTGTIQCRLDQLGSECNIDTPGASPSDETCDGADNDCDGLVDETIFDNIPANDPGGVQGWVTDDLVTVNVAGVDTYVFQYESSHPTATLSDAGLGTATRACSRPDVIPWSFLTYVQAAEACARAGARLCRSDEWEESCNGSGSRVYPYGNSYNTTACNGHDMDPATDEVEPTGTQSNCASQGYNAEDLSGNLREWTSDFVGMTGDGRRVFRLRGGSYIDLEQGLRCDFSNSAYVEDALASHVGFRCCSTCGNGTVDRDEACDPVLEPATCHPAHCGYLTCGDGNLDAGEDCDDGNLLPADGCSPACLDEAFCGDGVVGGSEACDDGNGTPFDGCSPLCTGEDLLLSEDMQSCPAGGSWTVQNGGGPNTWDCQNPFNNTNSTSGGRYIYVVSTAAEQSAEGLVTPVQDLSTYTKVQLSFYHAYLDGVGVNDSGEVQYSTNGAGGPWTTVATYAGSDIIGVFVALDVSATAGQSNVAFRFYYDDNNQDGGWWQIDDVEIRAY